MKKIGVAYAQGIGDLGSLCADNKWGYQCTFMGKLCMAYAPEAAVVRLTETTSATSSTTNIETKD